MAPKLLGRARHPSGPCLGGCHLNDPLGSFVTTIHIFCEFQPLSCETFWNSGLDRNLEAADAADFQPPYLDYNAIASCGHN